MSSSNLRILGTDIPLNTEVQLSIDIARLHTRTRIDVPVIVSRGKSEGPVLLITAGIHGDEVNGVEIVRQLISTGLHKPEVGTVICIPVVNVFGFLNQSRAFPDGRDLNRHFPGTKKGSLASRFAYYLMHEIAPYVDYSIDFHTGGASRFNYAHLRIEPDNTETMQLANAFGVDMIKLSDQRERSFREALNNLGKQALLFEGGKALHLSLSVTRIGVLGCQNIMAHLGMKSKPPMDHSTASNPVVIRKSIWQRADLSGMFRSFISVGKKVNKGMVLGTISDPYGDFEKPVKAKKDGYVICTNHTPIVNQGDALFHIGQE